MTKKRAPLATLLLFLFLACTAPPTAEQPQTEDQPRPSSIDDLPWPARPGARLLALRRLTSTVDRVVLVPDVATFEYAMRQWTLLERWPILIEDDHFTPMFIRRFQPANVYRMSAVKSPLPKGDQLQQRLIDTAALAWQRPESDIDIRERAAQPVGESWQSLGWVPPGVVITSTKDTCWPAALALAADRGQPITFYEEFVGRPDGSMSAADWPHVVAAIEARVASTGYAYDQLGDIIDTVTLVRNLPVKYKTTDAPDDSNRLAVTDGLARHADGKRWAIVGWIFGNADRAVYQAMCSIFLNPDSALLYDSYPASAPWSRYEMRSVAQQLTKLGMTAQHVATPEATARNFLRIAPNGLSRDLIFVNTKGNQNWFDLNSRRVFVHDLPILNTPAAVHFIHSWSAFAPGRSGTLAGRWLDRGAYVYVGSVHEPGLSAFVPPAQVMARATSTVPLPIAARVFNMNPWKVTIIGDPLMSLLRPKPRRQKGTVPIDALNLRDDLKSLAQTAINDDSPSSWARVARTSIIMGHDEIAARVYREHLADRAGADDLLPLLPSLFMTLDADEFAQACIQIPAAMHTPRSIDLFWLKSLPVLDTWRDKTRLMALRQLIRSPLEFSDACHLAPALRRAGLGNVADALLNEVQSSARDGYAKQLIAKARRH